MADGKIERAAAPRAVPGLAPEVKGILLALLAMGFFGAMDALSKTLVQHYPAPLILWLRHLVAVPLVLAVLAPVDLAVSKLARFQDQDRSDLASLARRGLLHGLPFQQRVGEALSYYVGDSRWLRYNLRDALALIDANTPAPVPRRGPAPGSFRP